MSNDRVIGIGFNPEDPAPTVMLKGSGEHVAPILSAARAAGDIPIVRDAALAEELYRVPIDAPIGREPGGPMGQLFPVMAVLLAQVLDLDQLTATEESSR
jgi:type III secretion system FlhB-like substrate exporter